MGLAGRKSERGTEALCEFHRQAALDARVEVARPSQESVEKLKLGRRELGRAGVARERHLRLGDGCPRRDPVAHDHGARHQVPEPLVSRMQENHDEPRQGRSEREEAIQQPTEVPRHRRPACNGVARVEDDAETEELFA